MTYKEAKERLDSWYAGDDVDISPEVLDCCYKALLKVTAEPKKPVLIEGRMRCPNCRKNNGSLGFYCDNCGQAIDWDNNTNEINKEFNTKRELYNFLDTFDFDSAKDTELASVYFLVEYDGHIEPLLFMHYKDVWFPSPCALRYFPLANNEVSKYVKDMYEAESWIEAYEYEKAMQRNGVHYEIDCPQCTPFLPERIKIKEVFSDIECLNWLLENI